MSHPRRLVGPLALLFALLAGAPALAAPGAASAPPGCRTAVLTRSAPAYDVARHAPSALAAAAARQGRSAAALTSLARDHTLWLDRCGQGFVVEKQVAGAATAGSTASDPATATVPLSDTFTLESRPGAKRTIYLDFLGGTVTNTAWNQTYGASISVDPYSITAPADTAFTDAELTEIQRTWQVVAEDYAPFDVNVTTRDLGAAAIDRSSSSDDTYGTRVMVTGAGPIYSQCGCGGISYLDVFNDAGSAHAYYQPSFVFSDGTGTNGKYMGEASAHEVGHAFGLHHDGTATVSYYAGASPWAPIMGNSYSQPISTWSQGEYTGANNTEDDLAIIATGAPLRADDHGGTAGTASDLANGATLDGVIGNRSDVDAFSFSAGGSTTLTVSPAAGLPDLDVALTVVDSSGATVVSVDPAAARMSYQTAAGLGATWSVTLPATPERYTAYIDGTGTGDPTTAGRYSDYASLGNYQIALSTQASQSAPLCATGSNPPAATVGAAYSATPVTASGGTGGDTFTATGMPAGLSIAAASGTVSGTPTTAGTSNVAVTVTDSSGSTASATVTVTVQAAAPVTPLAFATSSALPSGRTGQAYTVTIATTGGSPAYTWTRTGSLPAGLTLTTATDGRSATLAGTPTGRGKTSFTLTVRDGSGASASRKFSVSIGK